MHATIQDVKCSLRILRRHRAVTLAAVCTLALAIGATTAMFSVVHGVLLRPLPFAAVDKLVTIWETDSARGIERQLTSPLTFAGIALLFSAVSIIAAYIPARHASSLDPLVALRESQFAFSLLERGYTSCAAVARTASATYRGRRQE